MITKKDQSLMNMNPTSIQAKGLQVKGRYSCSNCNETMETEKALKMHMNRYHRQ